MSVTSAHPKSLLGRLGTVPDPRCPQWRIYPLASVLGMLLLAASQGESSLRGMWLWAKARWDKIASGLGFTDISRSPALSTVWTILSRLDPQSLDEALSDWAAEQPGQPEEAVSVDGKTLRGSKRAGARALQVVAAVGQQMKMVLKQRQVAEGDEIEAAIALLQGMPLAGRVVTLDAGLTQSRVTDTILGVGGEYVGILKENHPKVKEAVEVWIEDQRFAAGEVPPDAVQVDKGHGRIERREVWVVDSRELGLYLEAEYGWRGVQLTGYIRRFRKKIGQKEWESIERETWIASLGPEEVGAEDIARLLRGHWAIENGAFRVRDVSYDEDRLHGRSIGVVLATLRNGAMNLIRKLGYKYIPDGWREISARPDYGLEFLTAET